MVFIFRVGANATYLGNMNTPVAPSMRGFGYRLAASPDVLAVSAMPGVAQQPGVAIYRMTSAGPVGVQEVLPETKLPFFGWALVAVENSVWISAAGQDESGHGQILRAEVTPDGITLHHWDSNQLGPNERYGEAVAIGSDGPFVAFANDTDVGVQGPGVDQPRLWLHRQPGVFALACVGNFVFVGTPKDPGGAVAILEWKDGRLNQRASLADSNRRGEFGEAMALVPSGLVVGAPGSGEVSTEMALYSWPRLQELVPELVPGSPCA